MGTLVFSILLALGSPAWASEDPLVCSLNSALSPGQVAVQVGVREFQRDFWAGNQPGLLAGYANLYTQVQSLNNTTGIPSFESLFGYRFELDMLWQKSARNLFEISMPYYDQELSPYVGTASVGQPSNLNDSAANKSDTYGDLGLGWRGVVLGTAKGPWSLGLGLDLDIPTGQGPFSSPNILVATGVGGFSGAALLDLEASGSIWKGWIQGRLPYELGYSAYVGPGTFVAYDSNAPGPNYADSFQGGNAWVNRAFSYTATAGFGWDWYVTDAVRHRVAVEVQLNEEGALLLDGQPVLNSYSMELDVIPEARFAFDKTLAINLGWVLPTMAENRFFAQYGEIIVRLDYTL